MKSEQVLLDFDIFNSCLNPPSWLWGLDTKVLSIWEIQKHYQWEAFHTLESENCNNNKPLAKPRSAKDC